MNPTDPREEKPPFVMPLIHGLNCEKVCHERANGYLHAPDYDGPYDVDGLKYCGRCHTWLPETPEQLQATNSKLAAEVERQNVILLSHSKAVGEFACGAPSVPDALRKLAADLKNALDGQEYYKNEADVATERLAKLAAELETVNQVLDNRMLQLRTVEAELETAKLTLFQTEKRLDDKLRTALAELEAARKERDEIKAVLFEKDAAYEQESPMLRPTKASVVSAFARLQTDRDTAIAAKDAAEKLLRRAHPFLVHALCTIPDSDYQYKEASALSDEVSEIAFPEVAAAFALDAKRQAALTPAPTQEPPAGGVTISNDSSLPKAGNNAETREGIVPAPSDGKCDSAAIVLLPRDDREQVGQATPDVRPVPAVTSSNSPADVPSVGRGELLPFNLSDALSGKPVVTRDRWKASNIKGDKLLGGIVNGIYYNWYLDGKCTNGNPLHDLFMLPTEGSGA